MPRAVNGLLRDELHVHLYGCLTADDLFTLGKDRIAQQEARLDWYAQEYERAWGRRPDWRRYWREPSGRDLLKADFEFTRGGEFAKFQACFNLAIALLPASATDTTVLAHVLERSAQSGLAYMEVRCFVPLTLSPDDTRAYMLASSRVADACARTFAGQFVPRLAFSLSRRPETFAMQYQVLRDLMEQDTTFVRTVVGIDLCGVEEGNPPRQLRQSLAMVTADNARDPERALAILYHVGESWGGMSLASSVRWVHEAQAIGAHRLGHALALGVEPQVLPTTRGEMSTAESISERQDHLRWLLGMEHWLGERGYRVDQRRTADLLLTLEGRAPTDMIQIIYDDETLADTRRLQNAVLKGLAEDGAVIETCPTSNLLIGRLGTWANHPVKRFLASGVDTVLAADDPGTFATTLTNEEGIARRECGVSATDIAKMDDTAKRSRSSILAGRPA